MLKRWLPHIAIVVAALLAAFALFVSFSRDRDFTEAIRDGLVESCERNGNPLRAGVTSMLQSEITQSEAGLESGQFGRFFPNIPEPELRQLVKDANDRRREIIAQIQPVDCKEAFPK